MSTLLASMPRPGIAGSGRRHLCHHPPCPFLYTLSITPTPKPIFDPPSLCCYACCVY